MNTNIAIELTDEERNLIVQKMTGTNIKRLLTRGELNDMVKGFVASMLSDIRAEVADLDAELEVAGKTFGDTERLPLQPFDASLVPKEYRSKPLSWQMGWFKGRYLLKSFRV